MIYEEYLPKPGQYAENSLDSRTDRHLFRSNRYTQFSVRRIQQIVGQIGRSAGILKKVHPHMLRHTRATLLTESGMAKDVLQQFLGHESGATTEIYTRTANLQLNQEFQKIAGQHPHI